MKTNFVKIAMLTAALITAPAFADDAQTQMNNQQPQAQTSPATPANAQNPSLQTSSANNSATPANNANDTSTSPSSMPNSN